MEIKIGMWLIPTEAKRGFFSANWDKEGNKLLYLSPNFCQLYIWKHFFLGKSRKITRQEQKRKIERH